MGFFNKPPLLENSLNIHFVIMKSENDIILPWCHEVIDQQKIPGCTFFLLDPPQ